MGSLPDTEVRLHEPPLTGVRFRYPHSELDFQLRSCLFGQPILRGIAPSPEEIGEPRRSLYKRAVRPILPDARAYHHTPVLRHMQPHPWCVLEYASPDGSREVAGVFRLTGPSDGSYRDRPRGLRPGARYRATFDNTGETAAISWLEVRRDGLEIWLESPWTPELLLIEQAQGQD